MRPYSHRRRRKSRKPLALSVLVACAILAFAAVAWPGPSIWRAYREETLRSRVSALVNSLMSQNADASAAAAADLAKLRSAPDVRAIVLELESRDTINESIRTALDAKLKALWLAMGDEAVDPLIECLRGDIRPIGGGPNDYYSAWQREALARGAMRALMLIGQGTVDPLTKSLASRDVDARRRSARILGELKDPRAVTALIAAVDDFDESVSAVAIAALGALGDDRSVSELLWLLKKGIGDRQGYAALALARCGGPGKPLDYLLFALKNDNPDVRAEATGLLAALKDLASTDLLIAALRDSSPAVRAGAAAALGALGNVRAVMPLGDALEDRDAAVVASARAALDAVHDPQPALDYLLAALSGGDLVVQRKAAHVLGLLGDRRASLPLLGATAYVDEKLCCEALLALGKIGDETVLPQLIPMMRDSEGATYRYYVEALGLIGDPVAVDSLIAALKDDGRKSRDPSLEQAAIRALERIKTEKAAKAVQDYRAGLYSR